MRKSNHVLLMVFAMVMPIALLAQVVISGTVVDQGNAPLAGVSVQLRNSSLGTTTDATGKFTLSVPSKSGVLQFSYIGYQLQTVNLANAGTELTIKLQEEVGKLQEVVVTGIASSIKRSNLANAVSSVTARELVGTTVQP
ncbi:MAG: carboxypeptidase-like regulatory domain-containing protein, partial [Chitinophagaceae bacterium]